MQKTALTLGAPAADELATIVRLVRADVATTKARLASEASLGRNIVTDRLNSAVALGLLEASGTAPSTGGRAPEIWRFRAEGGVVLVAVLGAAAMTCALADLAGTLLSHHRFEWSVATGPEPTLARVDAEFRSLLEDAPEAPLWGIGIGLASPVDYRSGRPVDPPIMAGWNHFDVAGWFSRRFDVGVWVDNDVNCMAVGHRALQADDDDFIYVKVGTGIGSGLMSNGRLRRGAVGAAGDIAHVRVSDRTDVVCRCGRIGCLEAFAAGWALARDATTAAVEGRSGYLREILEANGKIAPVDVGRGSMQGDPVCTELSVRSATMLGNVLAILTNFYNPARLVIGGGVVDSSEVYIPAVDRALRERANSLATRELAVVTGHPAQLDGVIGCAHMVLDHLLSGPFITAWAPEGSPAGVRNIVDRPTQASPMGNAALSPA